MKRYIVMQEDAADCGACTLQSIIKHYKGYVPLEVIKADTFTNEYGTNFFNLKEAAIKYGFDARGKKDEDLSKIIHPSIAQVAINGFYHFVVIYEVRDSITLMDPSKGIVEMNREEFKDIFTGYILELLPNGPIVKYSDDKKFYQILKDVFKANLRLWLMACLITIPAIILTLISSFNFILIKERLLLIAILVLVFNVIISYFKNLVVSHLNHQINLAILKKYIHYIFNLPLKYLQLKKAGDLTNRINDLYNVKDIFSKTIIDVLINFILFLSTVIILSVLNLRLSLMIMIVSLIYIIVSYNINKKLYLKMIKIMDSDNTFIDRIIEYLKKVKCIKNLKLGYFLNKLDSDLMDTLDNKHKLDKAFHFNEMILSFIIDSLYIIVIGYNIYSERNYIDIILYLTIYNYYLNSLKTLTNLLPSLTYFKGVFKRIESIFALDIEMTKASVSSTNNDIKIKKLSYSYNKLNNIIDKLNLYIINGSKVLIIGNNGSGKSTLLDIIAGNIKDYSGNVYINGTVNYISQTDDLFNDTILNNIILELVYDDSQFKKVEKITCLKEIIENKKGGYHTHIHGTNISGGEKQRIILARNLYRNFDILLLDEALSQISKDKREVILKNIFTFYKDQTIICVSHNKDNLKYDKVLNLTARKEQNVNK